MENAGFKAEDELKSCSSTSDARPSSKSDNSLIHGLSPVTMATTDLQLKKEPALRLRTKLFYWKNFVGVSAGVLCLLTAHTCVFYVQSSLHAESGLGSLALAVGYGVQVFACLFIPTLLMKKIGYKWTLAVSMVGVGSYIAANMHGTFATLMPTSVLMAIGFAGMWSTMNCLVCDLAKGYAKVTKTESSVVVSRFLGLYYGIIETSKIWGNLILSLALQSSENDDRISTKQLGFCGANYCNQKLGVQETSWDSGNYTNTTAWHSLTSIPHKDGNHSGATQDQIIILTSISLGICGSGIALILILVESRKSSHEMRPLRSHILSTLKMLANRNLQLLIVMTVCGGLVQSFYVSDFTKSFVTCSLGIHKVGFVSGSYGLGVVLGSLGTGWVAKFTSRQFLLLLSPTLNAADLLVMLFWIPDPNRTAVFYVMSLLWGIGSAIRATILAGLYGEVFSSQVEEAFSNSRLFECIGLVIGFVWSPMLCMSHKIYGFISLLGVGVLGYIGLEVKLRVKSKKLHQKLRKAEISSSDC